MRELSVKIFADPGSSLLQMGTYPIETIHLFPTRHDRAGRQWFKATVRALPDYPGSAVWICPRDIHPQPTIPEFVRYCSPDPPLRECLNNALDLEPL